MKITNKAKRIWAVVASLALLCLPIVGTINAWASNEISMTLSPMKQSIVLNPGDVYHGSFKIVNPNDSKNNLEYEIERKSFYVDEEYDLTFDESTSPIVDWTRLDVAESGVVEPNGTMEVRFTINVPKTASAGGQYEAFWVKTKMASVGDGSINNGAAINEQLVMVHLVYAEVTGDTIRQGDIISADVPGFLISGNINGSSSVRNTGNIHGTAKYTLQVYPLFSNEEVYTNEESPKENIILPDRARYDEISWKETPEVGVFNVVYTVEFEGATARVSKIVIKCPLWLLFIIIFVIALIVGWFFTRSKSRKKSHRSE